MNFQARARKLRSKEKYGQNRQALHLIALYALTRNSHSLNALTIGLSQVAEARAKLNEADAKIGAKVNEAESKFQKLKSDGKTQFDQARKDTARELQETADTFDKTVQTKTAEAKSGISSWFGFGK